MGSWRGYHAGNSSRRECPLPKFVKAALALVLMLAALGGVAASALVFMGNH